MRPTLTFAGSMAIVEVGGQPVFACQSIAPNETYDRERVGQLGQVNAIEYPLISFTGTVTISTKLFYINNKGVITDIRRDAPTVNSLLLTSLYLQNSVTIVIYRKKPGLISANQLVLTEDMEIWAVLTNCFLNSDSMNIPVAAVGDRTLTFNYTDPILQSNEAGDFLFQ